MDAVIHILERIQETLVRMDGRLVTLEQHAVATNDSLLKLHTDVELTNTTLGMVVERLGFFERAATVATEGRSRLEDRVDRLASDMQRLQERVDKIESSDA